MKFIKLIFFAVLFQLTFFAQSNNSVEPLIQNDWATFTWPYNAYYPESSSGGINGHVGNACGHNAIARLLHYYGFPVNGNEVLDFSDYFGNDWYCDLTKLNLNYSDMPNQLNSNATEEEYHEVAKLFLAAGAVGEKIKIGFSGALAKLPEAMIQYFNFSTNYFIINRWEYSREEWIEFFKYELDHGRPIIVEGRTPDSPAPWEPGGFQGHWWICDGYNEQGEFYVNYSFNNIKGYYDIDNLGEIYIAYNSAIVGLEPERNGKAIIIDSPNQDSFSNNEPIEITWTTNNINQVNLEASLDGGKNWQTIDENISASLESYSWLPNDVTSPESLIKLVDAADVNIYKVSNRFEITDLTNVDEKTNKKLNEFSLFQNFPNPFNPSTTIKFTIPSDVKHETSNVKIIVCDILGREIKTLLNKSMQPGEYEIEFDGSNLNSGIYFCVMKAADFRSTIKLILIK